MSEYQFYEFRAIDRPLTAVEQKKVSDLSSRVSPNPWRAIFEYGYSDFPADEVDILAKYYDAMFYISNWGTVQLIFRFPKDLVDINNMHPYCVEYRIDCHIAGAYVILTIEWNTEGGSYGDWVEGAGDLDMLIPLREAILQKDYRLLYLAWLSSLDDYGDSYGVQDSEVEPPVPAGLKNQTPALKSFATLFQVDQNLLNVASSASTAPETILNSDFQKAIINLSREEADSWLMRLVTNDEANLHLKFQRELLKEEKRSTAQGSRTVGELREQAEEEAKRKTKIVAEKRKKQRIERLEAFALEEAASWQKVLELIKEGKPKSYDEAVSLLKKLKELAEFKNETPALKKRVGNIKTLYKRRSGLLRRLNKAGLN